MCAPSNNMWWWCIGCQDVAKQPWGPWFLLEVSPIGLIWPCDLLQLLGPQLADFEGFLEVVSPNWSVFSLPYSILPLEVHQIEPFDIRILCKRPVSLWELPHPESYCFLGQPGSSPTGAGRMSASHPDLTTGHSDGPFELCPWVFVTAVLRSLLLTPPSLHRC